MCKITLPDCGAPIPPKRRNTSWNPSGSKGTKKSVPHSRDRAPCRRAIPQASGPGPGGWLESLPPSRALGKCPGQTVAAPRLARRPEPKRLPPAPDAVPVARVKPETAKTPSSASGEQRHFPGTYPLRSDLSTLGAKEGAVDGGEGQSPPGAWVCTGLFLLLLLAGLALLAYILLSPFLIST